MAMKTLSLVPGSHSDIAFKVTRYPDGQQDIVIAQSADRFPVQICSRFNSFADLELILCATSALRIAGFTEISLRVPYLLGARSDRCFQSGGTSYLRDVVAPIINRQHYEFVSVFDPHSDASDAIRNLLREPTFRFLVFAVKGFALDSYAICPDKGAHRRTADAASFSIGDPEKIVTCEKVRDPQTGKILETVVPLADFRGRDTFIVDDICDGGRTFIEIAKVVRTRNCGRLSLIVSHGIFSQGVGPLADYFDHIYCTDSVKEVVHPLVSQFQLFKGQS